MSRLRPSRRLALALALVGLLACGSLASPLAAVAAVAAKPRTSLPVIERQVMCVTCKIPLNVALSPQADREREYIQSLIDQGEGESEIKTSLVNQYGPAVLGLPAAHGFDLTAYLVPLAVVIALACLLVALLPSWRRHARSAARRKAPVTSLDPTDAARLETDIARFD